MQPEITANYTIGRCPSGDVELSYRSFGAPCRTPILIVHGLSFFSYDWIGIASELASDRQVVAMDMRGFGDSSWSPSRDYALSTLASDIITLMDHLGWTRAILVGHSMGGRVCLVTAALHSSRIAGLVCVDFAPDVATAGRRQVAERIGRQPDLFKSVSEALSYHGQDPNVPADSPVRRRYEAFLRPAEGGYILKRDLYYRDSFRQILESGKAPAPGYDLWGMLASLDIATLFLRGSRSNMFEAHVLDKVRAANPRAVANEIEGGHDLAGDSPGEVVGQIRSFLERSCQTPAKN